MLLKLETTQDVDECTDLKVLRENLSYYATETNSKKTVVNGSFGKLGSQYSKLYAPDLFKQVTITGQLALMMLIEHLDAAGIRVLSANTDGVVTMPRLDQLDALRSIYHLWESVTGYVMEETRYKSLHCRDVNNYIAIKTDGGVKTKGTFATGGLMKNPQNMIIGHVITELLSKGTPIATSIRAGTVQDYLTVRTVKGGGEWRGQYLGKVVRWYWSTDGEPITYVSNGNKVATSDGAKPMMRLSEELPDDIDFNRYESAANDALTGLGL